MDRQRKHFTVIILSPNFQYTCKIYPIILWIKKISILIYIINTDGCSVDICKEDVFRPHDCTSLQRDARCSEEDLKYPNRKEACDCCHLPPRIIMPPVCCISQNITCVTKRMLKKVHVCYRRPDL